MGNDKKARKELGKKLKNVRKKKKLTQAQVAKMAEIQPNYYSRIERGEENPSFEILNDIAKALKVKLSDILPS